MNFPQHPKLLTSFLFIVLLGIVHSHKKSPISDLFQQLSRQNQKGFLQHLARCSRTTKEELSLEVLEVLSEGSVDLTKLEKSKAIAGLVECAVEFIHKEKVCSTHVGGVASSANETLVDKHFNHFVAAVCGHNVLNGETGIARRRVARQIISPLDLFALFGGNLEPAALLFSIASLGFVLSGLGNLCRGPRGPQGEEGDPGAQGIKGPTGLLGIKFTGFCRVRGGRCTNIPNPTGNVWNCRMCQPR